MKIVLELTDREIELLRNSISDYGDNNEVSLHLKIANAILDANLQAKKEYKSCCKQREEYIHQKDDAPYVREDWQNFVDGNDKSPPYMIEDWG